MYPPILINSKLNHNTSHSQPEINRCVDTMDLLNMIVHLYMYVACLRVLIPALAPPFKKTTKSLRFKSTICTSSLVSRLPVCQRYNGPTVSYPFRFE